MNREESLMSDYSIASQSSHTEYYSEWTCANLHRTYFWLDNLFSVTVGATGAAGIFSFQDPGNIRRRRNLFVAFFSMIITPSLTKSLKNTLSYHFWTGCPPEQISNLGNIPIEKVNQMLKKHLEKSKP